MLNDLVQEVPFEKVMKRFGVNRGVLQSLQTLSSTFAGMVTVFCEKLGLRNMGMVLLFWLTFVRAASSAVSK